VPNRYAAALMPVSAFTYCGPRSMNSLQAVVSSRRVKFHEHSVALRRPKPFVLFDEPIHFLWLTCCGA
jgi:hypothetical protein